MARPTPPSTREVGTKRIQGITLLATAGCIAGTVGLVGFVEHQFPAKSTSAAASTSPVTSQSPLSGATPTSPPATTLPSAPLQSGSSSAVTTPVTTPVTAPVTTPAPVPTFSRPHARSGGS